MSIKPTRWGSDPAFVGPRHAAREAMMLRHLGAYLAPPARVLDVGAGAGSFARLLASRGFEVVGIDASEAFVAHASALAVPGTAFAVGDATQLAYPAASFRAVIAGEVLEHLADDAGAVGEFWRVLAPGGLCLVTVPADPRAWDFSDAWAGHVRRYEGAGLRALFERQGFRVVRCLRWGFPFVGLYHRAIFLPLLRRKLARASHAPTQPLAGAKAWGAGMLRGLFALDRLFEGAPWGPTYVLVAEKPPEGCGWPTASDRVAARPVE